MEYGNVMDGRRRNNMNIPPGHTVYSFLSMLPSHGGTLLSLFFVR